MRLPSLRLPAMGWPSFDWLEGVGGRRTVLYAVYTGALFLVFLLVNFPHHVLVQRFLKSIDLQRQGMRLEVGDTRFAWWRGYELQRVRLASTDPDRPALVEMASLFIRPGFDGLLRGQVNSASLIGLMYGGEVDANLAAADGLQRANVNIEGLQLQRYPLVANLLQGGTVAGVLSGVVTIESVGGGSGEVHAAGELALEKANLTDAKISIMTLPALHFDKASLKFSLQGERLDVQELEANGPDLRLSLSGQIALREPVLDSVLNLKFTALPSATSPEEIKNLLLLLPPPPKGAKPDTPHVLSGTVARPRVR
jgi:type II secretion system protein N